MKCKTGYKSVKGKCKKVNVDRTEKQVKIKNKWTVIILFSSFSLVLFVNNVTDFFVRFGLYIPVQWITWAGLVLVVLYNEWLVSEGKL